MVDDFSHLGSVGSVAGQNVRTHHEFGSCPMTVRLVDDAQTVLDVYARDVESTGMLFICRDMLKVGQRVEVHLLMPGGHIEVVAGKVIRHKRVDATSYGIAVHFDQPVSPRCLLVNADLPA